MIRIQLDDATRDELHALRRTDPPAKARDRIEMVAFSDAGWSAPRIAEHFGDHPQIVRDAIRPSRLRHRGPRPFRSGPAPRRRVARGCVTAASAPCWPSAAPGPAGS
ncbi:MAG: hypothetical protein U0835_12730 [Isosphaeraceae bacterium]